jgi:cell division protease FtsH
MDTLTLTPVSEPEELHLDEQRPRVTISVSRATAAHLEGWLTEKRLFAAHEAAHCAVACLTEPKLGVTAVSISGQHSGWTETDEDDDRKPAMQSERQLWSSLLVSLAGWAMEHALLGQVTTGSESDLKRATAIALRRCAAGMTPDEIFVSLDAFRYDETPRFLTDRIGRSVVRQLTEARLEVTGLVAANRDCILTLAETIFNARRLSDCALHDALIEAGFEPLRTGDDPKWP